MKVCEECSGTGVSYAFMTGKQIKCPVCNGRGVIFRPRREVMEAMTDEQLAEYLVEHAEELEAPDGDCHKHAERFVLGWLRQGVEE